MGATEHIAQDKARFVEYNHYPRHAQTVVMGNDNNDMTRKKAMGKGQFHHPIETF